MRKLIVLLIIFMVISCSKDNDETNKILLLQVDYTTNIFECGKELIITGQVSDSDTIPIYIDYKAPCDFGNISFYNQPTNELIFDGSIIWMGTGQINYPENFQSSDKFAELESSIEQPDSSEFQIIYYDLYNQQIDYALIWNSINKLEIVVDYLKSNKKIGLFLYTPSVGVGDLNEWDWFVIMNK